MNSKVRIWFVFCLFFSIYNLLLLIDDSYLINYIVVEKEDELYDEKTKYHLCFLFEGLSEKDEFKTVPKNVTIQEFITYAKKSIEKSIKLKSSFNLNESFVLNEKVCFPFDKEDVDRTYFRESVRNYVTIYFIYSKGKIPFIHEYIYRKSDFHTNFTRFKIVKQKVYGKNYLDYDCFSFKDQFKLNRHHCLNECCKKIDRFNPFYIDFNENTSLDLDFISGFNYNPYKPKSLKINISKFEICFDKCPDQDCFLETYNTLVEKPHDESIENIEDKDKFYIETIIYKAYYSTSYFYLQFIGLLTLFTGTSFVATTPALVSLIAAKFYLKYNQYFARYFPKFKFTLVVLSLTIFIDQSSIMYYDYKYQTDYPNQTNILNYTIQLNPFSLILCLPIENLIYNSTEIVKKRNSQILSNYSFDEIVDKSNSDRIIEDYKFVFLNQTTPGEFTFEISNETMFKNQLNEDENLLIRCYRININFKRVLKFQTPISAFSISSINPNREIYLILRNQQFTSNLVQIKGECNIGKFVTKKLNSKKSSCKEYKENKTLNCVNRQNCIDRCINEKFFKKYESITINSVIHEDEFKPYQLSKTKFNELNDKNIERECSELFEEMDCLTFSFNNTIRSSYFNEDSQISINLYFSKFVEKQIEQSFTKLVLNILNLESILFGSNATSLLLTLFYAFKKTFKLKWYRAYRIIIFIICSIGFLIHNYYIFDEIIKGELIDNGYFEKTKNFKMPNVAYCFPTDQTEIDINHRLTGNYLNKLSKDITYETVFERIFYQNRSHFKEFIPNKTHTEQDNEISINTFYYLGYKCLEFDLKILFDEEHFYFITGRIIFRVYFKKSLKKSNRFVLFMYRISDSKEFTNIYPYRIGKVKESEKDNHLDLEYRYQVSFEQFKIKRDDKFEALKNPMSLFSNKAGINDITNYLEEMKQNFEREFNLTTREIMLENSTDNFKYEIDDELFKQYYLQIQNVSDQSPSTFNYEKNLFNIYSQITNLDHNDQSSGDFDYSFSFISRQTEFTNDDNYAKLIQSLLNTLSLWLNIGILDVHIYLFKLPNPFKVAYKFLIKLKEYLELLQI